MRGSMTKALEECRAVFKEWFLREYRKFPARRNKREDVYWNDAVQISWIAWKGSRDRYAPKLTEDQAAEIIAPIICKEAAFLEWDRSSNTAHKNWYRVVKRALAAAGVRFAPEKKK